MKIVKIYLHFTLIKMYKTNIQENYNILFKSRSLWHLFYKHIMK